MRGALGAGVGVGVGGRGRREVSALGPDRPRWRRKGAGPPRRRPRDKVRRGVLSGGPVLGLSGRFTPGRSQGRGSRPERPRWSTRGSRGETSSRRPQTQARVEGHRARRQKRGRTRRPVSTGFAASFVRLFSESGKTPLPPALGRGGGSARSGPAIGSRRPINPRDSGLAGKVPKALAPQCRDSRVGFERRGTPVREGQRGSEP